MSEQWISNAISKLNFDDPRAAERTLQQILEFGVPFDLVEHFVGQLQRLLARFDEPDRILTNVIRFLEASRSPQAWLGLFEREEDALATLLRLFSTSQYMADLLINDSGAFDLVRVTDGQPVEPSVLKDEIVAEVSSVTDIKSVQRILRGYRHRETLRIAYGDFINGQSIDTVTGQLSGLADAIIEAAVVGAQAELAKRRPAPSQPDGSPVRFSVIALGKLGGQELNYSSDIDLVFIRETLRPAPRWEKSKDSHATTDDYFQRLGQSIIKLLNDSTPHGIAYRVDMRLRPHGKNGPLVTDYRQAVSYYDTMGRTWERQAYVKARAIAGDLTLGQELIEDLQPWIFRRYLMRADITGLVALKRRIEQRAIRAGDNERNVKLGHGGIRDIEYVIQFLQLLHGADQPDVRCTGTLEAIRLLQTAGCITASEQTILQENYRYLRTIEHHLQIMFDRKTHTLPEDPLPFDRLAARIEHGSGTVAEAGLRLREQLAQRTRQNRQVLDHLLQDAFSETGFEIGSVACAESDLLLNPEPSLEEMTTALQPYGFADCAAAYRHFQELAVETIPFLSTRRSRHFLAAIAPKLLAAISKTPSPDATLISLANVSASLGGKAVLWELFSVNPPSMELCLRLCATSPYLTSILTSNPGMMDELLDSLMLDSLPSHDEMTAALDELCRGAVEIAPMLHSFKNSMHLRVGVRDILGKSTIAETHAALSDIAEVCMEQVIHNEFHRLVHRLGVPTRITPSGAEEAAELVVLAVGKLGGREPNYHSDLDVIFLFDGEGATKSLVPNRRFEPTTNRHFFNQLCQRVIHAVTRVGTTGRLYELDVRLRPLGRSGQLAISIDDLRHYFESEGGQIWERQALCKARPIWGSQSARAQATQCVRDVLADTHWRAEYAQQIYNHRMELQHGANEDNLKRGVGGTMDVEFVVQLLQLANWKSQPQVLIPGTLEAIDRLRAASLLQPSVAERLHQNYQFLRSIESGIRLMDLSGRHELPKDHASLQRLAFLLKSENRLELTTNELASRCQAVRQECRAIFDEIFDSWLPQELAEGADGVSAAVPHSPSRGGA